MVKLSVTSNNSFFCRLETLAPQLGPTYPDLANIIETACHFKAQIVESNPQIRLHSLYGHVVGHAVESLLSGQSRHGDCISVGINAEGFIALQIGLWREEDWRRQLTLLRSLDLPTTIPSTITLPMILDRILKDKPAKQGAIKMILPQQIGQVHAVDGDPETPISVDRVEKYLKEFMTFGGE
jgi:3-dehydroquinate synthase